ncbi:A/G-specific adenine glycosylase [Nakamurella deserti]|uniref:A/G-specific adenine glycosylase n=1 Tax=Nakamurella deserti TaxID=2164074 RepID=UPI001F0C1463|nr:A/G-specific adenine glycosylase [Nakamurella deserti]
MALLRFFDERSRTLPWRDSGATPWRVLTSEVMLQQTPVVRVAPVFEAWMLRWPTPAALAAEPSGEPLRAWGRLGYPRRALRLWMAAGVIVERFGGAVPTAVDDLLTLPGVGQYTARAVAAFGAGRRVPVVDTNVRRVMNRVLRGTDDAGAATPADLVLMEQWLPAAPAVAARFSAAVMELGALVCTAAAPKCPECPLVAGCRWVLAGRPASQVRRRTQAWHGTDRQARGRILALLREADEPLPEPVLAAAWPEPIQFGRCLASLVADGLTERTDDGRYTLPR